MMVIQKAREGQKDERDNVCLGRLQEWVEGTVAMDERCITNQLVL